MRFFPIVDRIHNNVTKAFTSLQKYHKLHNVEQIKEEIYFTLEVTYKIYDK
jgi:hypothetical protein